MIYPFNQLNLSLFAGVLDPDHPSLDDFELWSPSEEREERCLFGKQASMVLYAALLVLIDSRYSIIVDSETGTVSLETR
jgi:hypothetical protein